jgi:hypothetical protein
MSLFAKNILKKKAFIFDQNTRQVSEVAPSPRASK